MLTRSYSAWCVGIGQENKIKINKTMQNEKPLCKQMNEHRHYTVLEMKWHVVVDTQGASLLLLNSAFSAGICFLSKPRFYFQDHVHWMEFLLQASSSIIKYFLY